MADEVARIGALSNGSNGQRSLESASLHFWALWLCKRNKSRWRTSTCPHAFLNCSEITIEWLSDQLHFFPQVNACAAQDAGNLAIAQP
jgi:hypothetical protein